MTQATGSSSNLVDITSNDLDILISRVLSCTVKSPAAKSICGFKAETTDDAERALSQSPPHSVHLVAMHGVRENNNSVASYHPHFLS